MSERLSLLPMPHMNKLLTDIVPARRWDGVSDFFAWQTAARARLAEFLCLAEIEPCRTTPDLAIEYDRYAEDLGCREIRFRFFSEEAVSVPCHLLIPKDAAGPLPVVICLQGHGPGMHISIGRPKNPYEAPLIDEGDRDFARRAVREGICALAMEQRCFGESGGASDNPPCRQAPMRALLLGRTMIGERVWDVMRAIDVLEKSFTDVVDTDRILCLGNSGGGTATVYASAIDERIKISVPSCAVCAYADSIGSRLHCECNFIPGIAKEFDMGDICALVAPRTLIVVNGAEDKSFPLAGAVACVEEAKRCYVGAGRPDGVAHVIGNGGHRFYADDTWGLIHAAIAQL